MTDLPIVPGSLDRTVLLVRDHLRPSMTDDAILRALVSCSIAVIADRRATSTVPGQHLISAIGLLCARSGAAVRVSCPTAPLLGAQPPLRGTEFRAALLECLDDLIRLDQATTVERFDIAFVVGRPRRIPKADRVIWVHAADWFGRIDTNPILDPLGSKVDPIGTHIAAGLAAAEAFKLAHRKLAFFADPAVPFEAYYEPANSSSFDLVAPPNASGDLDLGFLDMISAGAINQSVLYIIARFNQLRGQIRVIEPERSEATNLNRYAFLRRSRLNELKADDVASHLEGIVMVETALKRYDAAAAASFDPLAPRVVVGVDHIPTRWLVQEQMPPWLGVGATSHYDAMSSFHSPIHLGCAACAHPTDMDGPGEIPTASVISHWGGLLLAAQLVRELGGTPYSDHRQLTYAHPLQLGAAAGARHSIVVRHPKCPIHGAQAAA